jgi:hypothetical protein
MKPTSTSQQHKLSDEIRVAVNHQKIVELPNKRLQFYKKHAALVQKTLKQPLFQRFVHWMLKREHIEEHRIKDIQGRVLLASKITATPRWNMQEERQERKILVYPKRRDSYRRLTSKFGKESAYLYIKSGARAAFIHELLHPKYARNEVRRLAQKYLKIFNRHTEDRPDSQHHHVVRMLFPN